VIGAAIAVLGDGAAELRHRQDDGVGHALAEIACRAPQTAREVVEPLRDLSLRATSAT
jgi:hypothetical protein